MEILINHKDPVLLIGGGRLAATVAVCLLKAGHPLDIYSPQQTLFSQQLTERLENWQMHTEHRVQLPDFYFHSDLPTNKIHKLVVILTEEELPVKQKLIDRLEGSIHKDAIIAINSESFALSELKQADPTKLIGLNWTEPAYTTLFLEIITGNDRRSAEQIEFLARSHWGKDPYIVVDRGIRSRLISAMVREASYLIESGYASVEDIDRTCRNDAGYYLPFAGNCRYMDLMGTYAYGLVMKDLNPDLSKNEILPAFMEKILASGAKGMENGTGFYKYSEAEVENWKRTIDEFSYQIQAIIEKYPFNNNKAPYTD